MPWNSGQTFGYGSLAGMGVATIINAFGSIGLTNKSNAILQSQANIARINAQLMEFNAEQRLRSAEKDQVRLTMQAGQVKGSQKAAIAANGLATTAGSAVEVLASTDIIKEIDSNQIKENAVRDAWGMRMQAANYQGQALQYEAQKQSPGLVFGTTLLQGASQIANRYMVYDAMGLFDSNPGGPQATGIGSDAYAKTPRPTWGVRNGMLSFG